MIDHAGIAIISADRELLVQSINQAAQGLFGITAQSTLERPLADLIPPHERMTGLRLLKQALTGGDIINFEFDDLDEAGRRRHLVATLSPIPDPDGAALGVLACIRDITRRINLEAQLGRDIKMSSMGRMAGALAHHFNNILGGVVTRVDFALGSDDQRAHVQALRETSSALGRASKLIESLLTFAEGDVRHEDLCDLTEALIEVTDEFEKTLAEQNIKLEFILRSVPVTTVPRAQMVAVLQIIMRNAIEAMPEGGTLVIIGEVSEGVVTVRVTDTGSGMEDHVRERAFEPFFTTKSQTPTNTQSAGLGLAIAHGIMQVLGHRISIDSAPGGGAVITLRLEGKTPAR